MEKHFNNTIYIHPQFENVSKFNSKDKEQQFIVKKKLLTFPLINKYKYNIKIIKFHFNGSYTNRS